jgi:hypothetical protein
MTSDQSSSIERKRTPPCSSRTDSVIVRDGAKAHAVCERVGAQCFSLPECEECARDVERLALEKSCDEVLDKL